MSTKVQIGDLASEVMKCLDEFNDTTNEGVKLAVKRAGKTVREQIQENAPRKSGKYAQSWTVKTTKETSRATEVVVHSRNRYQLAHLLEFGHAKRGGGRVAGKSHIAPAEEAGIKQLEEEIARCIRNG